REMMDDLRLAVRGLLAAPVVTATVILSLALGIGANLAIFAIVNGLLLRTLPVPEPDRLARITTVTAVSRHLSWGWNYPVFEALNRRPDLFDGLAAWAPNQFNLAAGGPARFVDGLWVNGAFFDTLGVRAFAGRTMSDRDDVRGGGADGPVAVVSVAF